jgi:hypothetical protein
MLRQIAYLALAPDHDEKPPDVAAQNPSLPRQTKKIRQLTGATSGLEHDGIFRQLLIEGCGEPPLSCLHDEGLA